jgi:hypothetical protein
MSDEEKPLTWREMAILGFDPYQAREHRKKASLKTAAYNMRLARKQLRAEGWRCPLRSPAIPPPPVTDPTAAHTTQIADTQQRSNWYTRLPANARKVRGA